VLAGPWLEHVSGRATIVGNSGGPGPPSLGQGSVSAGISTDPATAVVWANFVL
jgi:hypothetical protein